MLDFEIEEILKMHDLWDKIIIDELGKKIVGEIPAREIIFLCGVGRLVKNANLSSFNLIIYAPSSSGKDYTSNSVLSIFNKKDIYKKTRISERTLNYWKPYLQRGKNSWDGSILYLIDVGETILNSEALKVMCSEGSDITIMERVSGKLKATDVSIDGKPVIICTTANSTPNEETLNRFLIQKLDESEEQTKEIIKFTTEIGESGIKPNFDEKIIKAINELKPYKVKIPFLKSVAMIFPFEKVRMRRLYNTFIDMIKAVTIIHQFQREVEGDTLIAELQDYDIAKDIFMNLSIKISDIPLNERQKSIVSVLRKQEKPKIASEIQPCVKPYIALKNLIINLETLTNLKIVNKQIEIDSLGRERQVYELSEEMMDSKPIKLPNGVDL